MLGKWEPTIRREVDRAQRVEHQRRMAWSHQRAEEEAQRRAEAAEMDLDVDRLDFGADGRL